MAHYDVIAPMEPTDELPVVRSIGIQDLADALRKGWDDFRAMPTHTIFLCLIYPVVGLVLWRAAAGAQLIPLLYPIAAGFALVGPFAAIWLYELSRRREAGRDTTWSHAFDVVRSPSFPAILALGVMLLVIFAVWVTTAHQLYVSAFGHREPSSLRGFLQAMVSTPEGRWLMLAGNLAGALFAVLAFVLSVVSFPLLLDRNVGLPVAIATSLRVVARNPVMMAMWGLIVTAGLVVGSAPMLLGLALVLPVLGHATWHLYRKTVEPDFHARPEFNPKPKDGVRYAADFPVSLFSRSKDVSE